MFAMGFLNVLKGFLNVFYMCLKGAVSVYRVLPNGLILVSSEFPKGSSDGFKVFLKCFCKDALRVKGFLNVSKGFSRVSYGCLVGFSWVSCVFHWGSLRLPFGVPSGSLKA